MNSLVIDNIEINDESDCYVIAEVGHNHQGNLEVAKKLMLAAKESGAHAVKLQKRDNKALYTASYYDKPYDHENSFGKTYGAHREYLEFGYPEYQNLRTYAEELGIAFFATAFDFKSADFLEELKVPAFKIASGDLKNIPLIKYVAKFQKPVIVSTGGGSLQDIRRMVDSVMPINRQLVIMQCTAGYPCAFEEMNLRVISTLKEDFPEVTIGLSAHDNGIAMSVVAYTLGARVIEKHFTLNRSLKGTDHAFSLEPQGMSKMVRDLKRTKLALGDGKKRRYESEENPLLKMGKKLVAARHLPMGHVLSDQDICIKSPGDGIPPHELENVLGQVLISSLEPDEGISWEHLDSQLSKAQ